MSHLAVIDPGTRVPELDCFNRLSRASPLPCTYHLPAQQGLDSLVRVQADIAGIVVLGSGASVTEHAPWQQALNGWLRERIEVLPMLGLCYGHQLLAHLLGGEVGFLFEDQRKLRGVRQVPLLESPLWGEAREVPLVVSHREHVLRTPPGTVNLGASEHVPVEAFQHETLPLWGIQAHPEATTAFTANNDIPFDADPSLLGHGHALVDAFARYVHERALPR